MKHFLFSAVAALSILSLHAQPKTTPKPPAPPVLKNLNDSASYAIGVSIANFYMDQGLKSLNSALITRAISDVMGKKTPAFDNNVANNVLNNVINKLQAEKSRSVIEAGEKFLAENKKRTGVTTTASGLQYEVITMGTGIKPTILDTFVAHYRGTLLDGTEFDASYGRGEPLTYPVNKVVQGWIEGLQLMPVGSKFKFFIPYQLGYGMNGSGPIPGGAVLVFELELLDVKKKG